MTSKVFIAMRMPADPLRTFQAFTEEIALWWQPNGLFRVGAPIGGFPKRDFLADSSVTLAKASVSTGDGRLAFEPGVGGRLYTTFEDGSTFEIGRVSVWEPGRRLVFAWRQASFSADQSTEVEVTFEAAGHETRVSIEHRAWDTIPRNHAARHGFPEHITLQRAADWWRASLARLQDRVATIRTSP